MIEHERIGIVALKDLQQFLLSGTESQHLTGSLCKTFSLVSNSEKLDLSASVKREAILHSPHPRFIHGSAWFMYTRNLLLAALPRTTKDARDALRGTRAKIHRCGLKSVSFRWMSGNKNFTRAWSESRNVSEEIECMNRPATLTACLALICSQSLFTSSTPVKIQRVNYVKLVILSKAHNNNPH